MVGDRDAETANFFMDDLRSRITGRTQLTTDGLRLYVDAVAGAFGNENEEVDYAMLVKLYGESVGQGPERRYSPVECIGAQKRRITGKSRRQACQHVSRRTPEPYDAHVHEKIYEIDEGVFKEAR